MGRTSTVMRTDSWAAMLKVSMRRETSPWFDEERQMERQNRSQMERQKKRQNGRQMKNFGDSTRPGRNPGRADRATPGYGPADGTASHPPYPCRSGLHVVGLLCPYWQSEVVVIYFRDPIWGMWPPPVA